MKKQFLITLLLTVYAIIATAQTKRIAILETIDKENKVPYSVEVMVRSNLTKVISNADGYEGYDRANISEIMDEHDFERTGLVSEEQIRQLGVISGADYLLVSEVVKFDESNIVVTAKILNVITAKIEGSENKVMGITAQDIQQGCESLANRLLGIHGHVIQNDNNASSLSMDEESVVSQSVTYPILSVNENNSTIVKKGKDYFLNGNLIGKEEYIALLRSNCPQAYLNYKTGIRTQIIGLITLGTGVVICSLFPFRFSFNTVSENGQVTSYSRQYSIIGPVIGSALAIGSIPMLIGGGKKKNNAYKTYNQYCAQPTATLDIYPTSNGLGVCLNF